MAAIYLSLNVLKNSNVKQWHKMQMHIYMQVTST